MFKVFWKPLGVLAALLICGSLVQISTADDTATEAPEAILNAAAGGTIPGVSTTACSVNKFGVCDDSNLHYYYCAVGIWWEFDCTTTPQLCVTGPNGQGFNCDYVGPLCV